MKNWMKKLVAAFVIIAMSTTSIQVSRVSAADIVQTSEEDAQTEQSAEPEVTDEAQADAADQTKVQDQKEETTDDQQEAAVEDTTDAAAVLEEQTADNAEESILNYAYIESPYLETPGTQRIVVSWAKEEAATMSLIVQKDDGTQEEWTNSKVEDQLYLFEKQFSDESQTGVYQAVALKVVTAEGENTYQFSDLGMDVRFGVNEEYEGIDELQPLDGEASEADDAVDVSIATINEDGTLEEQDSIADALETAEQDVLASQPATMSAENETATQTARSGKVVVALDPGHDKRHAGASANGLKEEVITLKIANYCKEELETYSGVEVYMTRTDADCPYPDTGSSGACIAQRANAAAAKGAKIFVSFHLNSASSESANGAEIIIPNNNWKPEVGAEGKELAEDIQSELTALGLKDRGIYSKDATDGATYDDGSAEDYFSVQLHNKKNGIPGIIIEHAFLTNSGDVNNFLNNEAGLKKLGVADAKGIAKYLDLAKAGDRVEIPEGTYLIESALNTNKVVTIADDGFDNKTAAVLNDKKTTSGQRFEIMSAGNGYYTITAEHSGKKLEVKDGSTASGAAVQQYEGNGSDAQLWYFEDSGNGYYTIHSALGNCLDVSGAETANGTGLDCYEANGTDAQRWRLTKTEEQPFEDGTYAITSVVDNDVLSIVDGSVSDGANVFASENKEKASQRFELTYVGNGYYKVIAESSGKSLDVASAIKDSGTNLQQYSWNGSNAQLWKFVQASDGIYYMKSMLGTTIGIDGNDGNVNMQTMNQSDKQLWKLAKTEVKTIEDGRYVIANASTTAMAAVESKSNIELGAYVGDSNQKCKITYVANGYYKIEQESSGKAWDVAGANTENGTNVRVYDWNGSDAQLWKFIKNKDGSYSIRSKLGKMVDVASGVISAGSNIQMYEINYTDAQNWSIDASRVDMKTRPIEDGIYSIQNATNTNEALDIQNQVRTNNANVQVHNKKTWSGQRFLIEYVDGGYYKIISELSGKVLDIHAGLTKAGTNIQLYDWNGTDAQLWRFVDEGNGYYTIISKSGMAVDINKSKAEAGVNVQTASVTGKSSQQWKVQAEVMSPVSNGTYYLKSVSTSRSVLDVKGGSNENKANVQIYMATGDENQEFEITHIKDGYCKIEAKHSGKVLECAGNSDSANVYQNEWAEKDTQLWRFLNISGTYYIQNKNGKVLDVQGASFQNSTNVQVYTLNETNAQQWKAVVADNSDAVKVSDGYYTIQPATDSSLAMALSGNNILIASSNNAVSRKFKVEAVGNGYYKIVSESSGKVLDIAAGSMSLGANVQQYEWNGSAAQQWKFVDAGNGNYYIQSKLGNVLDIASGKIQSGTNVQTYELNKSNAQKWNLVEEKYADVQEGTYVIQTALDADEVLDVASGSTDDGANVQIYSKNNSEAQNFTVKKVSDHEYQIICRKSGKALDVAGAKETAGTNVLQYTKNSTNAQKWRFVDAGDGYYYIVSNLGTVLDVAGAKTENATNVQVYTWNKSDAQKWKLTQETDVSELYPIMGKTSVALNQMVNYYNTKTEAQGWEYPYKDNEDAPTIKEFCQIYLEECEAEGVKAEVAFGQAMNETKFLQFGGDVPADYYNFAGIGATGNGVKGNQYPSIRIGIRAQVQHLKAYASTEDLNQECVDDRFKYVTRGCAEYVEWLGQKENPTGAGWATAENYGYNLMKYYINPLKNTEG